MQHATLKDLYLEQWLRQRESGDIQWTTKDGKNIPIKEMSNTHLANTIAMLERYLERQAEIEEERAEMWDHLGEMDPLEYYD